MTESNPHYLNERQSDLRAVKEGWYATDDHGNLLLGPFSSRENCLARISQSVKGAAPFESSPRAPTRSSKRYIPRRENEGGATKNGRDKRANDLPTLQRSEIDRRRRTSNQRTP